MTRSITLLLNTIWRWFVLGCLAAFAVFGVGPMNVLHAASGWPTDRWPTATPESQGMRSDILADMMDHILRENYALDSIMIVRNGYAILDTYRYRAPEFRHNFLSAAKSITSTLIGIAIDKGYIASIDQPLLAFFPEKAPLNPDPRKDRITLKHLLMMATGLECRDSWIYRWEGLYAMHGSEDYVRYVLNLPMLEDPGTRFEYCNGASFLLSAILQKATGQTALEFGRKHLFSPLGIEDVRWRENPQGITLGAGDLFLRPHDMAKIGYLFLNQGQWRHRQIVSARWVAEATRQHLPALGWSGYGYQWWVIGPHRYMAVGREGQRLFVLQDRQMVVVTTGQLEESHRHLPEKILGEYIVPAVEADRPLPDHTKALDRLMSLDRFWQTADSDARRRKQKMLQAKPAKRRLQSYVNGDLGFSVTYDSSLTEDVPVKDARCLLRKGPIFGLPVISILADDIPRGLKLDASDAYFLRVLQADPLFSDVTVTHTEMIHLPDGTPANYVEARMTHRNMALINAVVIAYHKANLICVAATGSPMETSMDSLKPMAMSLKLEK